MIHENEIIVMLKTKDQQLKTARKSLVFRPRKVSSTEENDYALEMVFGHWCLHRRLPPPAETLRLERKSSKGFYS